MAQRTLDELVSGLNDQVLKLNAMNATVATIAADIAYLKAQIDLQAPVKITEAVVAMEGNTARIDVLQTALNAVDASVVQTQ